MSNSSRIGVTNVISDVVLFLGKIAVSAASAFFCFVYLDHEYPDGSISSPILPVIIVFIAAFAITCMFFAVVEMVRCSRPRAGLLLRNRLVVIAF